MLDPTAAQLASLNAAAIRKRARFQVKVRPPSDPTVPRPNDNDEPQYWVLASMVPLLGHGCHDPRSGGNSPCEVFFRVIDPFSNTVLLSTGCIYLADRSEYPHTKTDVQSLTKRSNDVHGINPQGRFSDDASCENGYRMRFVNDRNRLAEIFDEIRSVLPASERYITLVFGEEKRKEMEQCLRWLRYYVPRVQAEIDYVSLHVDLQFDVSRQVEDAAFVATQSSMCAFHRSRNLRSGRPPTCAVRDVDFLHQTITAIFKDLTDPFDEAADDGVAMRRPPRPTSPPPPAAEPPPAPPTCAAPTACALKDVAPLMAAVEAPSCLESSALFVEVR
jgi:hypothetical protein